MTLLEILVKELPTLGGWPAGPDRAIQTEDAYIRFPDIGSHYDFYAEITATDQKTAVITREQYEVALAESKKVAWNGQGLPPVGCGCEVKRVADWLTVTINFISSHHTVFTTLGGTEVCYQTQSLQFRPIRSEEERKREESTKEMNKEWRMVAGMEDEKGKLLSIYDVIYDAIAAGKIPHVKIV